MNDPINTPRLKLIPLDLNQLELVLQNMDKLEASLNVAITRTLITGRVRRAVGMKVEKMKKADVSQHDWFTYWLVVIREENIGAGMLGFKGYPNMEGSTEIGYGIDAAYQNKGYMSEAVQSLISWAFMHPFCKTITATEVENPASSRLLKKVGAEIVEQTSKSASWRIQRR
jgi:RimJ/RimL family protein N-acetyltransferase